MSIGANIKRFRKERKLTQVELAEKSSLSRSYLADIEGDRYNPSVETLKSIAEALNIPTHHLLDEDNAPPPVWATSKDLRDFKKMLLEDTPVMFDGVPLDQEDKDKVMKVMEAIFWDAKKKNKRKPIEE
ncbi:helix-turn-helix domain-containing protein [Paenibacillus whitsoniae]|uniref:Helix-turn-helix domain-containing protein n=1 Tax=Paenibacillus whitsoniae TaxID=2496558 RepID=A0A3S0CA19_9BACL|nr:helix-turn-helix domain-containing protein [Paenibacillus whitsoniae]RTE09310.1 helix-turn-helix domain-containing protein [Paenibacillus whitsoniae]